MLLLVDLDGTVWRGAEPVPGVPALLTARVARGDTVVYVTNNSMHHRAAYLPRLRALGAPAAIESIVTSARAIALHVAGLSPRIERVLAVGSDGLVAELREVGLRVVTAGGGVHNKKYAMLLLDLATQSFQEVTAELKANTPKGGTDEK